MSKRDDFLYDGRSLEISRLDQFEFFVCLLEYANKVESPQRGQNEKKNVGNARGKHPINGEGKGRCPFHLCVCKERLQYCNSH